MDPPETSEAYTASFLRTPGCVALVKIPKTHVDGVGASRGRDSSRSSHGTPHLLFPKLTVTQVGSVTPPGQADVY